MVKGSNFPGNLSLVVVVFDSTPCNRIPILIFRKGAALQGILASKCLHMDFVIDKKQSSYLQPQFPNPLLNVQL